MSRNKKEIPKATKLLLFLKQFTIYFYFFNNFQNNKKSKPEPDI